MNHTLKSQWEGSFFSGYIHNRIVHRVKWKWPVSQKDRPYQKLTMVVHWLFTPSFLNYKTEDKSGLKTWKLLHLAMTTEQICIVNKVILFFCSFGKYNGMQSESKLKQILLKIHIFCFHLCVSVCMCFSVYAACVGNHRGQRKASDPLQQQL